MAREIPTLCSLAAALLVGGCVAYPVYRSQDPAPPEQREVPRSASLLLGAPAEPRPGPALPRSSRGRPAPARQSGDVPPLDPRTIDTSHAYQIGMASYCARDLHGRRTASGHAYIPDGMTAAHRVLALGTRVRVTNLENGRQVEVTVNDRGPFREERLVDVSYAAALQLGLVACGTAKVMLEVVEAVD